MKIILKTKRLYLREFMKEDGFQFYHLNNDWEVIKYTGNSAFNSLEELILKIKLQFKC
jgi:RimJ/RimL family protein N-acetyltransferase